MASSRAFARRSRPAFLGSIDLSWTKADSRRVPSTVPAIDWDSYAASYDALVWANPAYCALAKRVAAEVKRLALPSTATVADIGCGTGTFTGILAEQVPAGRVYALDSSTEFLAHLDAKFGRNPAIRPLRFDMDQDELPGDNLDAVVAIHVLCHARRPGEVLRRIHDSLRPGGTLIVSDIGRPLVLKEWSKVVISDLARRYGEVGWGPLGVFPALGFALQHRGAARENRSFARRQREGLVWMHSVDQFVAALNEAGFEIEVADGTEFRGIDSFAVAKRPGGAR